MSTSPGAKTKENEEIIRFIDETNDKVWNIRGVNPVDGFDPVAVGLAAYEKAVEIDYKYGIGRSLINLGMRSFILLHNVDLAFKQLNEAVELLKELDEKKWVANAMLTMAIVGTSVAKSETALLHALRGVDYYENNPGDDHYDQVMAFYTTGTVYKDLKRYAECEKYYNKGILIPGAEQTMWGGRILAGLSNVYVEQNKYEQAIDMSLRSLSILNEQNNPIGQSRVLNDIGIIYKKQKDYTSALEYLNKSLEIRKQSVLKHFVQSTLTEIASVYFETGEIEKALDYLKQSEQIAIEINQPARLANIYQSIGAIYKSTKQFELALEYTEKFLKINNELHVEERNKKIENLQNSLLQEKEQEIERLRNVELKNAYDIISEKNKEILDSINYAKRIQTAILPPMRLWNEMLPDSFVLYKPKDIVAGDFYWLEVVRGKVAGAVAEAGKKNATDLPAAHSTATATAPATATATSILFAAADCTGHGVPGALVSVICNNGLNRSVREYGLTEPGKILDKTREIIVSEFEKSDDEVKDGMDISMCSLSLSTLTLLWSGANNPLWIIRGNGTANPEFLETKANKQPIGKYAESTSFKTHTIQLQKGDVIYVFTDGYQDQFGGDKGKKFRAAELKELLLANHNKTMSEQKTILDESFEKWKGNLEQIDDVCVIGVRI